MNLIGEEVAPSRDEVYQALVRSLRRRKGFGIVFVQCSPEEAAKIMRDLQEDLPQKQAASLSFDKPIDNLYDLVNELPNRENLNILFIQGLEKSLEPYIKPGFGGDGDYYNLDTVPTILSHLNQRRELFRDHFHNICFVFFLPLFAIKYIIRRSPDLFDWSAGVFEITTEIEFQKEDLLQYEKVGSDYINQGQYEQAITYFSQYLNILREIGDRKNEGIALRNMGSAYRNLGQYEQAIKCYQSYLIITHETGDFRGEGNALTSLGNAYRSLRKYKSAIEYYRQYLTISREIGDLEGENNALTNLGEAYDSLEQYEKALNFYQQSLLIAQKIGDRGKQSNALLNLGFTYTNLEMYDQALKVYRKSLDIAQEIGNRQGEEIILAVIKRCEQEIEYQRNKALLLVDIPSLSARKQDRSGLTNPIAQMGLNLIRFLLLFIVGFVVAYIFASFASADVARILAGIGSIVIIPFVVLVFCLLLFTIFLEL